MSHCGDWLFEFDELRLGNHQNVTEVTQTGYFCRMFERRGKGELSLPFLKMLKKLPDEFVGESFSNFLLAVFLLANLTGNICKGIGQRTKYTRNNLCFGIRHFFQINEIITIVRVKYPVNHYLADLYLLILLQKLHQWKRLLIETLVSVHYLHKRQRILALLTYFKLALAVTPLYKTLQIVDLVSHAVLFVRKIKKPNYRTLLAVPPNETLSHLMTFQIHYLLVLITTQQERPAFSLTLLLLNDSPRQHLITSIAIFQPFIESGKLQVPITKPQSHDKYLASLSCIYF